MIRWVALLSLIGAGYLVAAVLPLTGKELSLMLRSGYSSEVVIRELAARKFADSFDSVLEKELEKSGASQPLIQALRNGTYQLSATQIAAFREKQNGDAVRKLNDATSNPPGPDRAVRPSAPAETQVGGTMYDHLKDDLVYWHEGELKPFDDAALQDKRFYLLFFSAIWSKDGRQFTNALIDYYNRVAPRHRQFEVIFFSADRSAFAMENYVSQTNMPWPLVAYDKLQGKAGALAGSLTHKIPRLILAENTGKILSDSGETNPDFGKVLADLDKVLAATN